VRNSTTYGTRAYSEKPAGTKRLELLPEEALYLVERGALFCSMPAFQDSIDEQMVLDDLTRVPMSVQQAYSEMIGKEALTLEKYQVRTV
jgi:tRNA-splicing endonuclease subunit Sen54